MNNNKSYRVNTKVGGSNTDVNINLKVLQNYDILEILSLKIGTENFYRLHTSNYGCVVGRVLANGGVGVPNAKISMFIEANENTVIDEVLYSLYPYKTTETKNGNNVRYNLLPDEQVSECHQVIGSLPNKRLVLDDKNILEVFDTYYKYTTVTNESGDYMIFGVPTGNQTFHMDLDLSDIGFLSQKPIDMIYKGYSSTMFDNSMQFKTDSNIDNLVQVISQNNTVYVKPFWGEDDLEEIGITRNDINVNYKFEPTCIFIGSMVSDEKSSGFSKKCVPMQNMGRMDKLTTGYGTIEMIRKRIDGTVEDFPIMGNELIDGNGVWCYQIPMNLDYVTTDEYGNLVPTDNPEIGLPTRTRVRFRMSLSDFDSDASNNHLVKVLVPNNPTQKENVDYAFGTFTKDDEEGGQSFRDLFWNNVYTVKSYIPRIQKGNNQRTKKFSGIKTVNVSDGNNPLPYNNMRVNITFMFTLQCAIIKALMVIITIMNNIIVAMKLKIKDEEKVKWRRCLVIGDGLCPDLEGWYFAPGCYDKDSDSKKEKKKYLTNTVDYLSETKSTDKTSIDEKNDDGGGVCVTSNMEYFKQCVEVNLAMENEVIQFDFYNDWVNGLLYIPRWYANIRKKQSYLFGLIKIEPKYQACMEDSFNGIRRLTQQCALGYENKDGLYTINRTPLGCINESKQKCHKQYGRKNAKIFGKSNGGIVHKESTLKGQKVYYAKPCEWNNNKKHLFFATDIVLLGNINKCNIHGVPSDFEGLSSSTFQMPPSVVLSNMDSDGMLYGIKDGGGSSRCSSNSKKEGVVSLSQTFESYNKWSEGQGLYDKSNENVTEYAVTEISGIDWGISGPNQGENDLSKLYFPGGHFLGISCSNAEVNVKSCVNLSRVCELGVMLSQRQSTVASYVENPEDNSISVIYKHLIPTGFISRDEISDNNFRNIFATLNHNRLKTKTNTFGLREYNFIPLQPINFNGTLQNILKNSSTNKPYNEFRWDNDNNKKNDYNASAYTRTIEENSKDYYFFRFGVNEGDKCEEKYLHKENGLMYLPVYENSYYFYFGLKNGATAIDRFLHDYYALCPKKSEIYAPEVAIEVNEPVICDNNNASISIITKNLPTPYVYELYKNNNFLVSGETYVREINVDSGVTKGEYTIKVYNKLYGFSFTKDLRINEILPKNNEYNFYEGSCALSCIDYNEEPIVFFDDTTNQMEILPSDNGGIIRIKTPIRDTINKKPPYIYGFALVGGEFVICKSFDNTDGGEKRIYDALINEGLSYTYINNKDVILDVVDNENICTVNAWGENIVYRLYICYSCKGSNLTVGDDIVLTPPVSIDTPSVSPNDFNLNINIPTLNEKENWGIIEVDNITPRVLNQKLSFCLYDETVTLTDINNTLDRDIIVTNGDRQRKNLGVIEYSELNRLAPFEEWAFKKALYFDASYFNGDEGTIDIKVVGGSAPYSITFYGDGELIDDATGEIKTYPSNSDMQTIYNLTLDGFKIPTKEWTGGFNTKNPFYYQAKDDNNSVPLIFVKDDNVCNVPDDEYDNGNSGNNDNQPSGMELSNLII